MIDLHCHILHDMDDGPSELDESLELCRIAWSNHVEQIVVTPHIADFSEADDFLGRRDAKMQVLKDALKAHGIEVDLFPGVEVFVSDEIFYTDCLNKLTINQSRYILVEFPYSDLSFHTIARYVTEIKNHRLIPIVAHPERYGYFQRDYELVNFFLHKGVLFQVNADSLCRRGQKGEYKLAREMIKRKAASFLATDAHSVDYRPSNLLDMLFCVPKETDSDYLDELVNRNPSLVLQNKDITKLTAALL